MGVGNPFTYPEVAHRREPQGCAPGSGKKPSSYPRATGQLVFAQADLTPDVPYQLLDFPQSDPGFPNDSTGDQFFNAGQFDAYQTLGNFIGHKAAKPQADTPRQSRLASPLRLIQFRRTQR